MTLYLTTASNHQEIENKKQYILTEESIKQFELDLEQGKEIVASNYLKKEKNYEIFEVIICFFFSYNTSFA